MMSRHRKGASVTTAVVSAALCQPTRLCESAASCAPLALAGLEAERQWNNDSEGADDGDDRGTHTAARPMDSASWVAERCADFFGDHEALRRRRSLLIAPPRALSVAAISRVTSKYDHQDIQCRNARWCHAHRGRRARSLPVSAGWEPQTCRGSPRQDLSADGQSGCFRFLRLPVGGRAGLTFSVVDHCGVTVGCRVVSRRKLRQFG